MTNSTDISVARQITVDAAPQRAFDVFTAGIDRWWPRQGYSIGSAALREAVLEPRAGGRWFERGEDGSECDWGRVLVWDPPHRLVLAWQISHDWAFDPTLVTEVDVRFTAQPDGRTRIDLEHRHLDRYGEHAAQMREAYDSPNGWQGLLDGYAGAVSPMRFDQHTLVMLMLRADAPSMTEEQASALQDAHLAHTAMLVAAGHILAAGPPINQDDERLRGVSLWSVDAETARRLCAEDPAVRAGRFTPHVATWMVPAGQLAFNRVRVPRSVAEATGA
jgi:uncharacterized protein YndB with AHSA1/START domain/uncharacterized protein YciI